MPLVPIIADALQCFWVDRSGTVESRNALVQSFEDRMKAIEVDCQNYAPICIFAEATTTNGTQMISFKRGAFQAMRTIQPCFFSITSGQISPCYDTLDFLPLAVMLLTSLYFRWAKITIMPEFTPTPFMLEKHADKGKQPWEIYAWCVRDAMSKHSGYTKCDYKLSLKDKFAYCDLMSAKIDKATINGIEYEYINDKPVQKDHSSSMGVIRRMISANYDIGGDINDLNWQDSFHSDESEDEGLTNQFKRQFTQNIPERKTETARPLKEETNVEIPEIKLEKDVIE